MSDDPGFRFGPANAGPGGCCGLPEGCRITSKGCVFKVRKKAWQESAQPTPWPPPERPATGERAKNERPSSVLQLMLDLGIPDHLAADLTPLIIDWFDGMSAGLAAALLPQLWQQIVAATSPTEPPTPREAE